MRLKNIFLTGIMLLAAGSFIGCSSDDDDEETKTPTPVPEVKKGATMQVMVVFAPGQLGDTGYADRVMDGVNLIESGQGAVADTLLDMNFITMGDPYYIREGIKNWYGNARNPFNNKDYERRLLVLTEPYMLDWIKQLGMTMRDSDEILILKGVQEDVDGASDLGLGKRLHALNIPATKSAKRFCEYMDSRIAYEQERGRGDRINPDIITILRLYSQDEVNYRDGIIETLTEQRGEDLELNEAALSNLEDAGLYSSWLEEDVIHAAYDCGMSMDDMVSKTGNIFGLVDLGAANLGFDYFLLRQSAFSFSTLMLDARFSTLNPNRFAIDRRFDLAISDWLGKWVNTPMGEMPQATSYSDDIYCEDNIVMK